MLPKIVSLVSIVLLSGWMIYFMMGGLPLLILKHDDASDSRLVRGFFDVHYLVLTSIAAIGTLAAAFSDRRLLAVAIGCIALIGFTARRIIVTRMDRLRGTMTATDAPAIKRFRRLHVSGMVLNVVLLTGFFTSLGLSSADIVTCVQTRPDAAARVARCSVRCCDLRETTFENVTARHWCHFKARSRHVLQ